jgi:hypothetical protein
MKIVRFRVSDEIAMLIEHEAEELGVTQSALLATIVGNQLRQKRDIQRQMIDKMSTQVGLGVVEALKQFNEREGDGTPQNPWKKSRKK